MFERKVVEFPEFRPDARERFGWSLRDSFKKPRTDKYEEQGKL